MANELVGLDKWLDTILKADTALSAIVGARVYEGFAPDKDPLTGLAPLYPLVIFSVLSAPDINSASRRVMTTPVFMVKVVGSGGGYAALQGAADRIDALLEDPATTTASIGGQTFTILGCYREQPIQYPEFLGVRYNHLGGRYRCYIQ